MYSVKRKGIIAIFAVMLVCITGCALSSKPTYEQISQEVRQIFPECEICDTDTKDGNMGFLMETDEGIEFIVMYDSENVFQTNYTKVLFDVYAETVIEKTPEGVLVEKSPRSTILDIYIEGSEYIEDAAHFCAYIEEILDYDINKKDSQSLIFDDVVLNAHIYNDHRGGYILVKYSKVLPIDKSQRLGYEGMYQWLREGYEAAQN